MRTSAVVATALHDRTRLRECHVTNDYQAKLILAAIDYHRRGWVPLPIAYYEGAPIPPKGWKEWANSRPDELELRRKLASHQLDAIAVVIGTTPCVWLDADTSEAVSQIGGSECPQYTTSRGVQRVVRLDTSIDSTVDLRKFNVDGELRAGNCFSIVPPSRHRSSPVAYTWTHELPPSDAAIPLLSLTDVLSTDRHSLIQYLRAKTPADTGSTNTKYLIVSQFAAGGLDEIIESTLPASVGCRRQMLPVFLRQLMRAKPDITETEVAHAGQVWWEAARGRTRETSARQTVASLIHLYRTYDRSRSGVMRAAIALMDQIEAVVAVESHWRSRAGRPVLVRLATLCRAMDLVCGGAPWLLSSYDAAEIVGTDQKTAWRMLQRLQDIRLIRCIDRGRPHRCVGHGVTIEGDAAEYQFLDFPGGFSNE